MKNCICILALAFSLLGSNAVGQKITNPIQVNIDLNIVKDDKVKVTVATPKIKTDKIVYCIPKTVPGTYSEDNYGKLIDDFQAIDSKGNLLIVAKLDDNSWEISNAKKLSKITYWVNDSYDTEKGGEFGSDIFSPAGTNIEEGKNFIINTHGFVGYFNDFKTLPYQVKIAHPAALWGATSMTDLDKSDTKDSFTTSRYAELVENPIMYAKPDYTTFNINGMEILIAVYSPNNLFTAESITPDMTTMMTAQKTFLGKFNSTKKYTVLLYLSDVNKNDAKGFGALEHPTATTVVMPEMMSKAQLVEQMKDVVSHEFFHIVTPLTVHSKEIQDFDYNNPKMSQHLWMYEGVTEYFANLFQINQALISEADFYNRMAAKIEQANSMNDTMSFTNMSANVLVEPYKAQYLNVYNKGALIGMCIDIIIREKSSGERGILDLMQKLANTYGEQKAFDDHELFAKITELTYPEVGTFLKTHVAGGTPITYADYFAKVGVTTSTIQVPGNVFIKGQTPYITVNPETKEIIIIPGMPLNDFYTSLGIKNGDILTEINEQKYNLDNIYDMIMGSQSWVEGEDITVKIKRDGNEIILNGKIKLPFEEKASFTATDASKDKLKQAWLKG